MKQRISLACSVAALVIATLGSTPLGEAARNVVSAGVPRNSVGTLQLKRNAVTSSKIAPNAIRTGQIVDSSLLTADFKAGQIPQGPKGDKGDKGEKGEKGLTGYTIATGTTAPPTGTSLRTVTATCPTGKRALGGGVRSGASSSSQGPFVVNSYPLTDGAAWRVTLVVGEFSVGSLTAYAVCAAVT